MLLRVHSATSPTVSFGFNMAGKVGDKTSPKRSACQRVRVLCCSQNQSTWDIVSEGSTEMWVISDQLLRCDADQKKDIKGGGWISKQNKQEPDT